MNESGTGKKRHPLPKRVRAWGAVFNMGTSFFKEITTLVDRIKDSREMFKKLVTNKKFKVFN